MNFSGDVERKFDAVLNLMIKIFNVEWNISNHFFCGGGVELVQNISSEKLTNLYIKEVLC